MEKEIRGRKRGEATSGMPRGLAVKDGSYYFVTKGPRREWIPLRMPLSQAVERCIELKRQEDEKVLAPLSEREKAKRRKARRLLGSLRARREDQGKREHLLSDDVIKKLLTSTRNNAERKKMTHTLTAEDIRALLIESGGRCCITGIEFDFSTIHGAKQRPWIPSIDRIKNTHGYYKRNCRVVCFAANLAMNQWGESVLVALGEAIYKKKISQEL